MPKSTRSLPSSAPVERNDHWKESSNDPIGPIDPLKESEWENSLEKCGNPSVFHGTAWARVLVETYGYHPRYLIINGPTPFIFPWMEVKSWLTGHRLIALPFTDMCSTGRMPAVYFRQAIQDIIQRCRSTNCRYWEFRGGGDLVPEISPSTVFLSHQLKLDKHDEITFARFSSTTRTAIRKGESSGVQVEITREFGAVETFYQLLCRTRKRHGIPPQPFSFFCNLHRSFLRPGCGEVALARVNGEPAAGIIFLRRAGQVIYKYAASDERLQQYRASNLVLWRAIQHYIRCGALYLDFGRTSLHNHGLQRFKLAWGTEERRIGYLRYKLAARTFATVDDPASTWHTRVIRKLPTLVGQFLGHFLYRHAA